MTAPGDEAPPALLDLLLAIAAEMEGRQVALDDAGRPAELRAEILQAIRIAEAAGWLPAGTADEARQRLVVEYVPRAKTVAIEWWIFEGDASLVRP